MSVIPLAEAKDELGIPAADTSFDSRIQRLLDAAEEAVAARIGALLTSTVVEDVAPRGGVAVLNRRPIQSVTSVTVAGVATTDFVLHAGAGLLHIASPATVTYVTGFAAVPALVRDVILDLVRARFTTRPALLPPDVDVAEEGQPTFPIDERSILARLDTPYGRALSVG